MTSPRHCEPTGRANARPMTGSAKQSISPRKGRMDCFVASLLAMTAAKAVSTVMRALCLHIDRIERVARRHEQAVALLAAETDIGAGLGQQDLADPGAVRRKDLNPVIARADPAGADPDVTLCVDPHAIGEARLAVELHVDELLRVR